MEGKVQGAPEYSIGRSSYLKKGMEGNEVGLAKRKGENTRCR